MGGGGGGGGGVAVGKCTRTSVSENAACWCAVVGKNNCCAGKYTPVYGRALLKPEPRRFDTTTATYIPGSCQSEARTVFLTTRATFGFSRESEGLWLSYLTM